MSKFYTLISTNIAHERDNFYYNTQLKDKKLSIGWGEFEATGLTYNEIKSKIEFHYPSYIGTVNPDSGGKSLPMFLNLSIGDIVFVRGIAKILDIVVITGKAAYEKTGHYIDDYFLKVPFTSLFETNKFNIQISKLSEDAHFEVVYEEGRSTAMKELNENTALELLNLIEFI